MESEKMLVHGENGDTNIGSAIALVEKLESLHSAELTEHLEEMNALIALLEDEQRNGFDDPTVRRQIANLTRFREAAK